MIERHEATLAGRAKAFGLATAAIGLLALSLAAGAQAAKEYELNDSRESAYGPLAGAAWYTAEFETVNDLDWYYFYVKSYSQVEFSATLAQEKAGCSSYTVFRLYDRDGKPLREYPEYDFRAGNTTEVEHLPLTMDAGRYYLSVSGCDRYKFRIDPAASITTSRECGEAIVAKDVAAPQLAAVNDDLADNAAVLAKKAQVVHEAKANLRAAASKAKRLKGRLRGLRSPRKRRRVRAKLGQARSVVLRATERLDEARDERRPVWQEKRDLEAVAQQHSQQIAAADGQIAAFC